jgi:hypothetical protein
MGAVSSVVLHKIADLCDLRTLAATVLLSRTLKEESYGAREAWKSACMCPCMCGALPPRILNRMVGARQLALERGYSFMGELMKQRRVLFLRAACYGRMLEPVQWMVKTIGVRLQDFLVEGCDGSETALMLIARHDNADLLQWIADRFGLENLGPKFKSELFCFAFEAEHRATARLALRLFGKGVTKKYWIEMLSLIRGVEDAHRFARLGIAVGIEVVQGLELIRKRDVVLASKIKELLERLDSTI